MLLIGHDDTRALLRQAHAGDFLGVGAHDQVDVAGPSLRVAKALAMSSG